MTTERRYEKLISLPAYGPMYVSVSDNGEPFYSEGFAVRFYKIDGTEWIANFQPGWTDFKEVIEFDKTQNLLIVACGTCYIMNPNETKPIEVFGVGYSDVFKASKDRLILQDRTDLTIIEPDGSHWNTERISWDGISGIKVEDNLVKGLSYDPMHDTDKWVQFIYDIDTRVLTGGSYNKYFKKRIKPWWKVW
ncbi:MAG: hypothetical protein C4K58_07125 [Flavobacteriaceae bacterium]|nr:MAG: hypothetical protein C4K58_07125 [Flavobacteriaceae bacterium]